MCGRSGWLARTLLTAVMIAFLSLRPVTAQNPPVPLVAPPGVPGAAPTLPRASPTAAPSAPAAPSMPASPQPAAPVTSPSSAAPANPLTPPANPPAPPPATDQFSVADLDDLKKRAEAATDLTEDQKKTVNDLIEQARADLTQADELSAAFKSWQKRTEQIESARQEAQAKLEQAQREKPQPLPAHETLPRLEQALAQKQQDLVNATNELAQTDKRLAERPVRQKIIKDRLTAIPSELEAAKAELAKAPPDREASLLTDARRFRWLALRRRLENENPALQAESAFLIAQEAANIVTMTRQEWAVNVNRIKEEVSVLQREVLGQKSKDAEGRKRIAEEDAELAAFPEIRKIFETNMAYVDDEIAFREKEKLLKEELEEAESLTDWLNQKHKDLENRKDKIGTSKSFGMRLRTERRLLPDLRKVRDDISRRMQVSQEAQLHLIEVTSQLSLLSHLDSKVNLTLEQLRASGEMSEISDEKRREMSLLGEEIRRAYEQQQKYLGELHNANEAYVSTLDALDAQQTALISATESFRKFIDENILWVPTSSVLSLKDLFHDRKSPQQFFSLADWATLGSRFRQDLLANPSLYIAALLVWLALFFSQGKQRQRIQAHGQKASSRLNTAMRPTWLAVMWTVLKSLILPLPFFFLSWRGESFSGNVGMLSRYVFTITVWVFWLEIVRHTCRHRGLGVAHFQWPERVNRVVMVQLSSFIALATPLIFVVAIIKSRSPTEESLPLERVCGVAFYLLLSFCLHRLASLRTGILREWIELHPGGWLDRLAGLWDFLATCLPLFLAGLTIAGYTYAAEQLSIRLAQSLMVVFGAIFAKAIFVRWLTLRQRRIAIEHAREVRAALAESKGLDEAATSVKFEAQEARTNLVEVSIQSKRLLNTSVVLLSLACLWFIWIDVLPALKKLDDYTIPYLSLSFAKVLAAGVMAILFTTAARNIPGLLEMLLLERLPLDRSVRYAIGALTRYAIVFLAILTIGQLLGYNWENVQWLIAALTFGLGFGLQEIFANFVSGIIILFEQPVRVGDIVTIDSVTGTVSQIRIRSTTIVDWDRKEYIVPNKEFITGRLLNWTLSDTINRITLNIGVGYDSNPDQVRELLLQIVRSQPLILSDPPPSVSLDGLGPSTINFSIRAFLPTMDSRTETLNQLYARILRELSAASISIPFPQQDLHLRTSIPLVWQAPPAPVSRPAPLDDHSTEEAFE